MYWANFLHIYQPAGQQPDILEAIVTQSYRPILEGIKKIPKIRLTMNVSGALLETFDSYGHRDLIDAIRDLVKENRLELTGSAKYHALLPFLSDKEIVRQIKENADTLKFFIGDNVGSSGFFPPEMAYDEKINPILEDLGFKWIIIDEIAHGGKTGQVDYSKIYKIKNSRLNVFFRDRLPSNLIMSAVVRSYASLKEAMEKDFKEDHYLITGMDGETFGHHRPGLEKLLFEIFKSPEFELVSISDLLNIGLGTIEISPVKSTWASSEDDIERGIQFLSWKDPDNEIHRWQWELVDIAQAAVYGLDENNSQYPKMHQALDRALASDQFWWASAKPWWSVEEIERGAYLCLSAITNVPGVEREKVERAHLLYEKIVSTAFEWQRTGKIYNMMQSRKNNVRIPFKERTLEAGGDEPGVYHAFMELLKRMEGEAAKNEEYEKAVLWRDAIWKIKNKSDIYDAIHVIDLLRMEMPNDEIEKMIEKYKKEYRKIRGGQPEQRGN